MALTPALPPLLQLPGYFGPQRWDYYRLNTLGHNTLLLNNASQVHPVVAPITVFNATATAAFDGFAIVDLTAAYAKPGTLTSARRGFIALPGASVVVIVDELVFASGAPNPPLNLSWQLHTRAVPTPAGAGTLSLAAAEGRVVGTLALLPRNTACPSLGSEWGLVPIAPFLPDPPYDSAKGLTRVELVARDPASGTPPCTRIAVALGDPAAVAALGTAVIRPLSEWQSAGPFGQ